MSDKKTFTCAQCGRCCTNLRKPAGSDVRTALDRSLGRNGFYFVPSTNQLAPWLFEWEVEQLTAEAAKLGVEFSVRPNHVYVDLLLPRPLIMEWVMDFDVCPFHSDGRCSIYGRHPLVCRQYPFLSVATLSDGCPQAPPIPYNLHDDLLEQWLIDTYGEVYQNSLHFNCILHHNYGLMGVFVRRRVLRPAEGLGLSAVNRLVKRSGTVGFFSYILKNGLMTESQVRKLRTFDGAVELVKMLQSY